MKNSIINPYFLICNVTTNEIQSLILIPVERIFYAKIKLECCQILINVNEAIKIYQPNLDIEEIVKLYLRK